MFVLKACPEEFSYFFHVINYFWLSFCLKQIYFFLFLGSSFKHFSKKKKLFQWDNLYFLCFLLKDHHIFMRRIYERFCVRVYCVALVWTYQKMQQQNNAWVLTGKEALRSGTGKKSQLGYSWLKIAESALFILLPLESSFQGASWHMQGIFVPPYTVRPSHRAPEM